MSPKHPVVAEGVSSTFGLFDILNMKRYKPSPSELAEKGWNPKPGDLVPYYLTGPNTVELYNDVQFKGPSNSTAESFKITGLPH